jgi:hypothetical protein
MYYSRSQKLVTPGKHIHLGKNIYAGERLFKLGNILVFMAGETTNAGGNINSGKIY